MPVSSVTQDPQALTLTIVADLAAPPSRVWQIWSDPRQLERWWGPPTWPATFTSHDLRVGGEAHYVMTGPDGGSAGGWWRITAVDEPKRIEFVDGFSDQAGRPNETMPKTRAEVQLEPTSEGTRMTITSRFETLEQLEQLAAMGMVEGMTSAMGQIDALLAS